MTTFYQVTSPASSDMHPSPHRDIEEEQQHHRDDEIRPQLKVAFDPGTAESYDVWPKRPPVLR